jgi:release factor glutamine methyltransferase
MFKFPDVFSVLQMAKGFLKSKGLLEYKSDAEALLSFLLQIKCSKLPFLYNQTLSIEQFHQFERYILRRSKREPVAYITGYAGFMGFEFKVNKNVLIPRPETELLVEAVLKLAERETDLRVLDLCTGSGCIAISLAKVGSFKAVTAIDVDKCVLEVAKENARINCIGNINFIESNIFTNLEENKFDIIVSNPPYVSDEEYIFLDKDLMYEPKLALVAKEDGLFFYTEIAKNAKSFFNNNGYIFLELNSNKANQIKQIFVDNNFKDIEIIKDYSSLPRILKAKILI